MTTIGNATVASAPLGNALTTMLTAPDITPGDAPSYQLCKAIAMYHPLGAKMSDGPVKMAQSQARLLAVEAGSGVEDRLKEAFEDEWKAIGADKSIRSTCRMARIYGVASVAILTEGTPPDRPLDYKQLADATISINIFDPLNTAGSLVLNQDPNAMDFQKVTGIVVNGKVYHRSRSVTMMNEEPLYIEYTTSAFGFVGRSVYQRALYALKSFIQTMVTDNLVSLKAGVLVAKMKAPGSVIDQMMANVGGLKRNMLKSAVTENVISIDVDEAIESLNLQNVNQAMQESRKNILENIATAADMPAVLLNQETFAEGFGEGTEDAKKVAAYIDGIREWMTPLYDLFDQIVMYRAWNERFFKTIQKDFPEEYGSKTYLQAFMAWRNSFRTEWPNLLEEPDSEKVKVDDVRLRAVIALLEVLLPQADPDNKAILIDWACDNFNALKLMFDAPLNMDADSFAEYEPPEALNLAAQTENLQNPPEPKGTAMGKGGFSDSGGDGRVRRRIADAVEELRGAVRLLDAPIQERVLKHLDTVGAAGK